MKKYLSLALILFLLGSCVSLTDRVIPRSEMGTVGIIGKVEITFTSWQFMHIINKKNILKKVYSQLLEKAKFDYGDDIDIRNINIKGSFSGHNIWLYPLGVVASGGLGYSTFAFSDFLAYPVLFIGIASTGNMQKITATGDVVSYDAQKREQISRINTPGLDGAINRAGRDLINDLPNNTRIAVINISSNNENISAIVVDELEFLLVSSKKFTIVDRSTLEAIRKEQNFQMSGDISDASAVSIGNLLGANIVITGNITRTGTSQRLSIRALNVTTAQIVTMVRETFE